MHLLVCYLSNLDTPCCEDLRPQILFDSSSLSMKYFLFACVLILLPSAAGRNNCQSENNVNISSIFIWHFRQEIPSWILRNTFLKTFISQKEYTASSRASYKIVPLTNLNKYLHNGTSETQVNLNTNLSN